MGGDQYSLVQEVTLLAIQDTGSFSGTAQRLGISQSSVSRRIAQLESRLGGNRLISRTTRRVQLTEEGLVFAAQVRRAMALLHEAEQKVVSQDQRPAGKLRISLPPAIAREKFIQPLSRLASQHKALIFEFFAAVEYLELYDGELDMAVRLRDQELKDTKSVQIGKCPYVFVASPEYLNEHDPCRTKLEDHIFLASSFRQHGNLDNSIERLRHHVAQQNVRMFANDQTLTAQLARDGHGVAFLPWLLIDQSVVRGELVYLDLMELPPPAPVNVVYRTSLHGTPKLDVTLQALARSIDESASPPI